MLKCPNGKEARDGIPELEGGVPILTCRRVNFFSQSDERIFFSWLNEIKAVRRWEGKGDSIFLQVPSRMSDRGLRELLALFRRYRLDMRQLTRFQSTSKKAWFADPRKYWNDKAPLRTTMTAHAR